MSACLQSKHQNGNLLNTSDSETGSADDATQVPPSEAYQQLLSLLKADTVTSKKSPQPVRAPKRARLPDGNLETKGKVHRPSKQEIGHLDEGEGKPAGSMEGKKPDFQRGKRISKVPEEPESILEPALATRLHWER